VEIEFFLRLGSGRIVGPLSRRLDGNLDRRLFVFHHRSFLDSLADDDPKEKDDDRCDDESAAEQHQLAAAEVKAFVFSPAVLCHTKYRSEEHTSELQSR